MSKTDNTRPWELQGADSTVLGRIRHRHVQRHMRFDEETREAIEWNELHECDYHPSNNLHDFHIRHVYNSRTAKAQGLEYSRCYRAAIYYGGMNYKGGATKIMRKQRRRNLRSRERHALHVARWSEDHDFDLLPIREDARTIWFDLD